MYRVQADQLAVVGKLLDLRRCALYQHDVTELQFEVIQVVLNVFVVAVYCQHVNAVARSQVEVAHRSVAVTRIAAHDGLGQHHIAGGDGLEAVGAVDRQQAGVPQLDKITHAGVQHQTVACQ